ncbi:MAG: 4Fe-4S binding protein [Candidatus Gastranaerophilales bacterium]|nr:4Fe-4S binding protein [Candidatus Gastranaerophilales bacterium]
MKHAYKIRLIIALIIFILAILGICGVFYPLKIYDLQFAPLLQRIFIDFSVIAAVLAGSIILLTLLFGRFYCSTICPLGFLQEIAALIFRRKNKSTKNLPIKYFIAAITFGILTGGSAVVLRYFEPYTFFGSLFTISALGIVATAAVLALTFFKNRYFCTNLCPVGALLGLLSKISFNKIYISDGCVSCGLCEKQCPSGCINSKEKTVDNVTCVKCLKCLEVCPKNRIKFGKKPKTNVRFSLKRREVIIGATVLALFGTMVKAGIVLKDKIVEKFKDIILPPGAMNQERFINKCYNCNLCVVNCPNKIIVKADENFPTVHLDYTQGFCKADCTKCSEVCPTGAIKRLSLEEKQKTRIALGMIKEDKCTKCGLCVEACPYGAITKEEGKPPVLNGSKCVGCGVCKQACHFASIEIFAVKQQSTI